MFSKLKRYKKSVINNLPKQKASDHDGSTGEFNPIFKEEILLILWKLFQKTE